MRKLFISCPMKGRTEENIKASMEKMHKIAEAILGEELEVILSYIEHRPPENSHEAVWYLGESIKKLSEADVIITVDTRGEFNGCDIERTIAHRYGIGVIEVDERHIVPDLIEARMSHACGVSHE